jgi:hypothetical protein
MINSLFKRKNRLYPTDPHHEKEGAEEDLITQYLQASYLIKGN